MATPIRPPSVRPGRSGMDPVQSDSLIDTLYRCVYSSFTIEARNDRERPIFGHHQHVGTNATLSISSKTAVIERRE